MSKKRIASVIFFLVGIYGLVYSVHLPMGKWNEPGPAVFPVSLSILLLISGILWFIYGKGKEEKERIDWQVLAPKLGVPFKILVATAAFILVMEPLGFLLASLLYLFVLLLWVSRYNVWTSIGIAVAIGGGSWYFFGKVLAVQLPRGPFPLPF
jgi:putative tricarboxylic transport membrane protein